MPHITQFVPADEFLTFRGVTVYRTYDDDMYNPRWPNSFIFGLSEDCEEDDLRPDEVEGIRSFDVRHLPAWVAMLNKHPEPKPRRSRLPAQETPHRAIRETIKAAIRKGLLKNPEEQTLE